MADPWLKFYPTDWRSDPALRMCSAASRGVWIDLICLMHEATPYGHLLVNGRCPTDAQVAVLTGTPPDQLSQCLRELEDAGVFSRTKDGTIYSRKMTRMAKKAATARNNGRKGGNPTLGKESANPALDNPQVKGGVKPQKLEPELDIPEAYASGPLVDPAKDLIDRGVAYLGRHRVEERQARSLIGKWRKEAGDQRLRAAFRECQAQSIADPVSWITATLRPPAQTDLAAIMASIGPDLR